MGLLLLIVACGTQGDTCGGNGNNVAICRYNSPPEASILSPSDGAQTSTVLTAMAVVADDQTEAPALVVRWISGAGGAETEAEADAEGRIATELVLSPGLQQLRVEVIDADGEVGSDAVEIEVLAP